MIIRKITSNLGRMEKVPLRVAEKRWIVIFDLNVRLPGWAFFAAKCGVDLIGMYLSDVSGNAVSVKKIATHSLNKEIKAIDFINDIEVVFHPLKGMLFNRMLIIGQYVKSLRNVKYSFLFELSDAKPFFYKIMKELVNSRKI